ncbi:MAG: N-6 DNA methylase [Anaerolineaceae bacterium]|nr:N-6 DNA methylase [Anaerolineaceae bacterium]
MFCETLDGVAGFLLANGALGDSDTMEIRRKLIQNDKVEAIIILPREMLKEAFRGIGYEID